MYEKIKYDHAFGFDTFRFMITAELGDGFWSELQNGLTLPDIESEAACGCVNMSLFMKKFESMASPDAVRRALKNVRHGLHPSNAK